MRNLNKLIFTPLIASCVFVSGCSNVKKTLGIEKDAPDEFSVVPSIQPLDMPPDFYDLPKPKPGAPRSQDVRAAEAQKAKLVGAAPQGVESSSGQNSILEMAGAQDKEQDIRRTIDTESRVASAKGKPVLEQLGIKKSKTGEVIDPYEEVVGLNQKGVATSRPVNH